MSEILVESIGIIGLGLIGGSLARSLKKVNAVSQVAGFDLRASELELAVRLGVIDEACTDLQLTAASRVIVLATPVKALESLLRELAPHLSEDHILTDVGSVKSAVVASVERVFGEPLPAFVPGHPIAGSEKSGVAAAVGDLFNEHKTILTPLPETSVTALDTVTRLWRACGANVVMMSPGHHDEVLAATSHLPHLIAFSLVDTLAGASDNMEIFRYAAGGFRDFTRIAASDPVMWHDIYLSNRQAVLQAIDAFSRDLQNLRRAIEYGDGETLLGVFTRARAAREHFGKLQADKGFPPSQASAGQPCTVGKSRALRGSMRLCGDQSICQLSIIFGALADGVTHVRGFASSDEALATLQALRDMGVVIEGPDRGELVIHGVGLHGLKPPAGPLYVGRARVAMTLLAGIMSGQAFSSEIVGEQPGDVSISPAFLAFDTRDTLRSLRHLVRLLRERGASLDFSGDGRPLLLVKGNQPLNGGSCDLQDSTADTKTCVLLAALYASGETIITQSLTTWDHAERLLAEFGYPVRITQQQISVKGRQRLSANQSMDIPADFTLAFYFMVAASVIPGSDLTLRHVGVNESRCQALSVLKGMGADVELRNLREIAGEKVADICIGCAELSPFEITARQCLLTREEIPGLLVAAAFARSASRITGLSDFHQSDRERLEAAVAILTNLGVDFSFRDDDLYIKPGERKAVAAKIESCADPASLLASIVYAGVVGGTAELDDVSAICASYPGITDLAADTGINISLTNGQPAGG